MKQGSHAISMWLGRSHVLGEPEQDGGSKREGFVTTLYIAIKAPREELETGHQSWWHSLLGFNPPLKLAEYEAAAVRYLEDLRDRGEITPIRKLAVVVVFPSGFRIFEYDGERMKLKRDMNSVQVKCPEPIVYL